MLSAERNLESALTSSSRAVYDRALTWFRKFLSIYFPKDFNLPPSVTQLCLFIAFCQQNNLAYSTVCSYISIIGYMNKLNSLQDNTQHFVIKKSLQGLRKVRPSQDTRLPITKEILHELVYSLQFTCSSHFLRLLFKAMFLLAFHAFLRVGEMTKTNKMSNNTLQLNEARFLFKTNSCPSSVELHMKNFKHNTGKSCHILLIKESSEDGNTCPVKALWEFVKVRGNQTGPLFCFMDQSPISRQFFTKQLQNCLKWCNKDIQSYKGHSFRLGAASYAAEIGTKDELIQLMGRWNSNAYKKYIRIPMLSTCN